MSLPFIPDPGGATEKLGASTPTHRSHHELLRDGLRTSSSVIHSRADALLYVRADEVDSEQGGYAPNLIAGSDVMGALPGSEHPMVFGTGSDDRGYLYLDQRYNAHTVELAFPTLTTADVVTIEGSVTEATWSPFVDSRLCYGAAAHVWVSGSGAAIRLVVNLGGTDYWGTSNLGTLIGYALGDSFEYRVMLNGTTLATEVRLNPGDAWTVHQAARTANAASLSGTFYVGSNSTTGYFRGRANWLRVRDGGTADSPAVALFSPEDFVPGNRASGDTATDLFGGVWTLTRAAIVDTKIPTLITEGSTYFVGGGEITIDGTSAPVGSADLQIDFDVENYVGVGYPLIAIDGNWSGSNGSWYLIISSGNVLQLRVTANGVSWSGLDSASAVTAHRYWRVVKSGTTAVWSYSDDNVTWTVDASGGTLAATLNDGSSVGTCSIGQNGFKGFINELTVKVGGEIAVHFDPADKLRHLSETFWIDKLTGFKVTTAYSSVTSQAATYDYRPSWWFDGGDLMMVPHDSAFDIVAANPGHTIVSVIKSKGPQNFSDAIHMTTSAYGPPGGWELQQSASLNAGELEVNDGTSVVTLATGTYPSAYGWQTITGVFANGDQEIYLNGVSVTSATTALVDAGVWDLQIGSVAAGNQYLRGEIAAFAVFTGRLTDAEVLAVHNELIAT